MYLRGFRPDKETVGASCALYLMWAVCAGWVGKRSIRPVRERLERSRCVLIRGSAPSETRMGGPWTGYQSFTAVYDHLMTLSLTQYILHRYSLARRYSACTAIPPQVNCYGWRLRQAWRACIGVEERDERWQL